MKKIFTVLLLVASLSGFAQSGNVAPPTKSTKQKVYVAVEKKAEPVNGLAVFYKEFANKFDISKIDKSKVENNSLRIFLNFVVDAEGSITDIKDLKKSDPLVFEEAKRILLSMPKWKAAQLKGKNVASNFSLPITIKI